MLNNKWRNKKKYSDILFVSILFLYIQIFFSRLFIETSLLRRLQAPLSYATNRQHYPIQQNCRNFFTNDAIWISFTNHNALTCAT